VGFGSGNGRSGNDNGSLARLAAAAGGGVKVTLWLISTQECHENDNCIGAAIPENRMPICTFGLRRPAAERL